MKCSIEDEKRWAYKSLLKILSNWEILFPLVLEDRSIKVNKKSTKMETKDASRIAISPLWDIFPTVMSREEKGPFPKREVSMKTTPASVVIVKLSLIHI